MQKQNKDHVLIVRANLIRERFGLPKRRKKEFSVKEMQKILFDIESKLALVRL